MFYVYVEKLGRPEVIGGTVNLAAAQRLAEKRAKRELWWDQQGTNYVAEVSQGKQVITYKIEQKEKYG